MGYLVVTDPDGPGLRADTERCCHCGRQVVVRASDPAEAEKGRFCSNCAAFTCASRACTEACLPLLKRIEAMEARDRMLRSVLG